jgi:hypothetical protein
MQPVSHELSTTRCGTRHRPPVENRYPTIATRTRTITSRGRSDTTQGEVARRLGATTPTGGLEIEDLATECSGFRRC